ncbi:MAG TPA: hypothetical protein VM936_06720 [Pyrinomonadaceae bacterium]|jgi:hypothetical protein|nr:hypothetical protein [Pyrinomonadaceae bacterium]
MRLIPERQKLRTRAARLCAAALCVLALCASAFAQDEADDEGAARRRPGVNVKPLRDVAAEAGELIRQGRLGPETRVDVTATGRLNDDGTLKPGTVVLTWATGSDEAVASLAERFVAALSRSGLFAVFEGAKEVSIRLRLDETSAHFSVAADLATAERAKQLADGYVALLKLAAERKGGTREGELYQNLKAGSDGGRFAFTFEMQREALHKIIDEMLARVAARAGG